MDEMAPVMDLRQEEKEVRAGLRRRYLRQRLSPVDTSLRAPTRRDLTVVTTAQNLRRQEDADEVEDGDDSDEEEAAAGNARQGTKNRQGKDVDSDDDDDDDEDYRNNQPVATLALPEPETPSPTAQTFPPPQLAPSTSTTLMAPATPTTPATPPTPTFPVLPLPPPPVITLPPTTVVMTSTVMATPKPSANAPIVNNPQVESPPPSTTSTSISLMTTQPLSLVSSISVSSQPRKGVGNPETTSSPTSSPTSTETTETTPFAFEKSTPTPTPSLEDVRNGNDGGRDQDRGPPRGLGPAAEHALIGAGSIGKLVARIAASEQPFTNYYVIRWVYHRLLHLLDGMAHDQEVQGQGEWLLRQPATAIEPALRQDPILWARPARVAGNGRWPESTAALREDQLHGSNLGDLLYV